MQTPPPNPLKNRADLQAAFTTLEAPLLAHWNPDDSGPVAGLYRAKFELETTRLEAVSRYVWGLAPFTAGGGRSAGWPLVLDAIVHGTDPTHPHYWGAVVEHDQRSVEMAALGVALRLVPEQIWEPLSAAQKDNFAGWLTPMLDKTLSNNNWQFFRLMLTLGLRHVGRAPAHVDAVEQKSIDIIDPLYLGDGWYRDGPSDARDYYNALAFHYYGLLGGHFFDVGPVVKHAAEWRDRATAFGRQFVDWFAADGAALPFGRSLTYRFAQSAFWAACAVTGLPGLRPGEARGLLLRNMRWWWKQPILTETGLLSLGYCYPNLNTLEMYNSSASPYWAFKTFTPLQLPESHPFWAEPEGDLPARPARTVQDRSRMVLDRDPHTGHVTALSAGQWAWPLRHRDAKYAKFAYSTYFGPCVGTNHEVREGVGLDNTLSVVVADAIPTDGRLWQNRGLSTSHQVSAELLRSDWNTLPGVSVRTWVVPLGGWHVRIHRLTTAQTVQVAEGGFAAEEPAIDRQTDHGLCLIDGQGGRVGIMDLTNDRTAEFNDVEPNSSLYHSRAGLPMLTGTFAPGTHWIATAVFASPPGSEGTWDRPPTLMGSLGSAVRVTHGETVVVVDLSVE